MAQNDRRAQALIELAVFSAVLLYLISAIAGNYISAAYTQDSQLQAMRVAMEKSFNTSIWPSAARVSATYLFFEDRLNGDFDKYGSTERQPITASGSAMLSKNVMLTVDYGEDYNLPVMDLHVNGQNFELRTSSYETYRMLFKDPPSNPNPSTMADVTIGDVNILQGCNCPGACQPSQQLDTSAYDDMRRRLGYEQIKTVENGHSNPFYTAIVANNDGFVVYDINDMANAYKFDYNRNGDKTDDLPPTYKNVAIWQWNRTSLDDIWFKVSKAIGQDGDGNYPSYDMNGDLKEEVIYGISDLTGQCPGYTGYSVTVLAQAAGDVNMSLEPKDVEDSNYYPGMHMDMRIYTRTADNGEITYFDVQDQKQHGLDGSLSKTKVQRSQYDVVERVYQLNPRMANADTFWSRNSANGLGPVERCPAPVVPVPPPSNPGQWSQNGMGSGCCFEPDKVFKTCFDESTKTLFIRSIISDHRGRHWTTLTDEGFAESVGAKR